MKNLMSAFLKAQQDYDTLVKDAINPGFRNKYATLGAVQEAAFPALAKHNLVVLQGARSEMTDRGMVVYVNATLYHTESGECVTQELGVMPTKNDPQGLGSATTYLHRYLLMTMLGLIADDDDGNNASANRGNYAPQAQPQRSNPQPQRSTPAAPAPAQNGAPVFKDTGDAARWAVAQGVFGDLDSARAAAKEFHAHGKFANGDAFTTAWVA